MESTTDNSSLNDNDDINHSLMSPLEQNIKFYSLLTLQIPSVLCTIFIFYHFKWRRVQNQIYGILLIINGLIIAVELPITLYFLHEGTIHSESRCAAWITFNYSLFQSSIFLMAWTSFERYLFIYHERFILRHLILFHYGPIFILVAYCPALYLGIIVFYTCQPMYDVRLYTCGGACYLSERALGMYDWMGNGVSMEIITFLLNLILIIRHFIQRHKMKRAILTGDKRQQWHRSVKLCLQLIGISMLYFIGWIPYQTIVILQIFENSPQLAYILSTVFIYLPYLQSLLLPFVCILFMPEIKQAFIDLFKKATECKKNRTQNRQNPTTQPATIPYSSRK